MLHESVFTGASINGTDFTGCTGISKRMFMGQLPRLHESLLRAALSMLVHMCLNGLSARGLRRRRAGPRTIMYSP